jgi:hypothetical protein
VLFALVGQNEGVAKPAVLDPRVWVGLESWDLLDPDEIARGEDLAAGDLDALLELLAFEDDVAAFDAESTAVDHADDPQAALTSLSGSPSAEDLIVLEEIDPADLPDSWSRVEYLQRIERLEGFVAALKARAIVALAGEHPSTSSTDEQHVIVELALARRVGPGAATTSLEVARALTTTFPDFATALAAGQISEWHCRELVTATRTVQDPAVLARIGARVLPKARRLTPREFAREVAKAIAVLDRDLPARITAAREDRRVWTRELPDGMGFLGLIHDWPNIAAIHATLTTDGRTLQRHRGGAAAVRAGNDDARADSTRADALAARILGTATPDGAITWDPTPTVELTLVMDLPTLRAEADHVALLNDQPIPPALAREYADTARTWRRAVTDPVTGHLLDYGTRQYLPEPLRRYVLARDGKCRTPICPTRSATRLQLDHAVPYPAGPSTPATTGPFCTRCHQLKTLDHLRLHDTASDGSATLTTAWGHTLHIPARPFLHDPLDDPPNSAPPASAPTPPDDDPPPF